jgi:glutamate formiminotransferase
VLPLEAVPNVSEGRDAAAIASLADAFSQSARLLDVHSDEDHHRTVFTLVGEDDALVESLLAGVRRARELIDLSLHDGVHPRVGAADVVPLVPVVP